MADVTDRVGEHFRLFNEAVRSHDWAVFRDLHPRCRDEVRRVGATGWRATMTWEDLLAYCLAKPGAWQDEPWEGDVVVKVGAKIFAFLGSGTSVGVKCGASREAADEWLLRYPDDASVMAYIGRSGWNTLRIGGAIPDDELIEAIDASYAAIVSKLPRKDRPAQA
jgi:predicted DNA-binding protein (MmcQ/YjbR family)